MTYSICLTGIEKYYIFMLLRFLLASPAWRIAGVFCGRTIGQYQRRIQLFASSKSQVRRLILLGNFPLPTKRNYHCKVKYVYFKRVCYETINLVLENNRFVVKRRVLGRNDDLDFGFA